MFAELSDRDKFRHFPRVLNFFSPISTFTPNADFFELEPPLKTSEHINILSINDASIISSFVMFVFNNMKILFASRLNCFMYFSGQIPDKLHNKAANFLIHLPSNHGGLLMIEVLLISGMMRWFNTQ